MKVTAILGSPRKKGVSSRIAQGFMEQAETLNADTTTHVLNQMNFKGCQGCNACKATHESCILQDDLSAVLRDIQESDIVVFATPVYYWDVSGQFKCFFDRTWSLVKPDYKTNPEPVRIKKGKKAVFITSQGDVEEKHRDVMEKYAGFLTMYGFEVETIRAFGCDMTPDADAGAFIERAQNLAKQMI